MVFSSAADTIPGSSAQAAKPLGGNARTDLLWPLAIMGIMATVILIGGVAALVFEFDAGSLQREQGGVSHGISGRIDEIEHLIVPRAASDEAVANLAVNFDVDWAQRNIGLYLAQAEGFDAAFVLTHEDRPVLASLNAKVEPVEAYADFAAAARSLVDTVRATEARRGPVRTTEQIRANLAAPIQASEIERVDDATYVLTATLVQPDFGAVLIEGPRAPIVLTAMAIDQAFIDVFADRYLLQGLAIQQRPPGAWTDLAQAPLRNQDGESVATLTWLPTKPGQTLLNRLGPPILIFLAMLAALVVVVYRRSLTAARSLIQSEGRATHMAYHDALTGLPNRVLFFDRLALAIDQAKRNHQSIAVHCIDLDKFKQVNDTHGHPAGDELIREAARRMKAQCRAADTVARLAGDEFAVIQIGASPASAAALAARLIEAMRALVDLGASRVLVGCSAGIAMINDGDITPAEALRQADLALYRAKHEGRGRYCFFEMEMDTAIKSRRQMEADLRQALANDELSMVYQPQVDQTGRVKGVEALLRWQHCERGSVSPSYFVPFAEECGLLGELTLFTLRRALADSCRWHGLDVAVNISAHQLRRDGFADALIGIAAELGVDPEKIDLEITESTLLLDDSHTHDTLSRLREMGFKLVLDDFGTGYSSLTYLRRYPIDKIKIDRSFVAELGHHADADAIVAAIVNLGHALNLEVVAEGVETVEQLQRLVAVGCRDIQGYLFSRPVDAAEIDILSQIGIIELNHQAA